MTATDLFASTPLVDTHAPGPREKDPLTYRFAIQHSENGARIDNLALPTANISCYTSAISAMVCSRSSAATATPPAPAA